jgi:hypothetical protein
MRNPRWEVTMQKNASGLLLPLILSGVQAVLTLDLGKLSVISANPWLGGVQRCLVCLLFPGMFGAMAIAGNVHAWSLWVASGLNGLFYFVLTWIALRFASHLAKKRT